MKTDCTNFLHLQKWSDEDAFIFTEKLRQSENEIGNSIWRKLHVTNFSNMHWYTVQWVKHDVGWSLWVKWVPIWKVWEESEKVGKSQGLVWRKVWKSWEKSGIRVWKS